MKSFWLLLALLIGTIRLGAQTGFEHIQDGQELAAKLRALAPAEEISFRGILKIRARGGTNSQVPVLTRTVLLTNSWQAIYQSEATAGRPAEKLTIVHRPQQPNEYLYSRTFQPDGTFCEPEVLHGAEAARPFASSDFWLSDLGLDFLHWPQQTIIKREMRKSRPCKVLESRPGPASTHPYGRVVSWVDNETGGLVLAEAFDRRGEQLKQFEVNSVTRVDGQGQVDRMQIQNLATHSRTILEFDLDK